LSAAAAEGKLQADPGAIERGILVLALLAWLPGSGELRAQLGAVLGCSPGRLDRAVVRFVRAVMNGDGEKVRKVDEVILSHPVWGGWCSRFLQKAKGVEPYGCRFTLIADSRGQAAWDALWDWLLQ
jgi:hypothetical protein